MTELGRKRKPILQDNPEVKTIGLAPSAKVQKVVRAPPTPSAEELKNSRAREKEEAE